MYEGWETLIQGTDGPAIRGTLDMVHDVTAGFNNVGLSGPHDTPGGAELLISCSEPGTAKVWIIPSAWEINTGFEHAWVEAFMRGEGPEREKSIALVKRLLEAVVAGRFEETIRRDRAGGVVASTGRFYDPGGKVGFKTYDSRRAGIFTPRKRVEVVRYSPYS